MTVGRLKSRASSVTKLNVQNLTSTTAVERVGRMRIKGFPKQFIVNAHQQQYSR